MKNGRYSIHRFPVQSRDILLLRFAAASKVRCMFVNVSEPRKWSAAKEFCKENNAMLLKVDSQRLANQFRSAQG